MEITLARGFQITVVAGLVTGLWINSWSLVFVCIVCGLVVYMAAQKMVTPRRYNDDMYEDMYTNTYDGVYGDMYGDMYDGMHPDAGGADNGADNGADGAIGAGKDVVNYAADGTLPGAQQSAGGESPTATRAVRVPLYKDDDWKFVKPWYQMDTTQQYMYRPSDGQVIEPLDARRKFVQYWARDANAFATKDMYTVPRSGECPTKLAPSV